MVSVEALTIKKFFITSAMGTCKISLLGKDSEERRWHLHAVPAFRMCRAL